MPEWNLVHRPHVLAALAEYDRLGSREFLRRHGFGRAKSYMLWHDGQEYDSKAVLGAAYLHATGRPVTPADFSGGEQGAAKVLRELGFDVVAQEEPVSSSRARKTPAPKARKAAPATVKLCPSCHVAVPASGVCDFCD